MPIYIRRYTKKKSKARCPGTGLPSGLLTPDTGVGSPPPKAQIDEAPGLRRSVEPQPISFNTAKELVGNRFGRNPKFAEIKTAIDFQSDGVQGPIDFCAFT
jgi:hypothetical protein